MHTLALHRCADIASLSWARAQRGCVLTVSRADGPALSFVGFRPQDLEGLQAAAGAVKVEPEALAASGHNWGSLAMDGASLVFRVGGRPSFRLPLPEVSGVQQGRDEVVLELPADDTGAWGSAQGWGRGG